MVLLPITDAEDLVQETFLQAIRSIHRYGGRARVYTWLYSILLNLSGHQRRESKWLVFTENSQSHETRALKVGNIGVKVEPVHERAIMLF